MVPQKVALGDPLLVNPESFNAFVEAAQDLADRRHTMTAPQTGGVRQASICHVQNNSGESATRYAVLGIDGPLFGPQYNSFQDAPAFTGVKATSAHVGKFVIVWEPAATGNLLVAAAAGVSPVKINVVNASHTRAEACPGSFALVSSTDGSAVILWREGGTGEQWALVRLGQPAGGAITYHGDGTWIGSTTGGVKSSAFLGNEVAHNDWDLPSVVPSDPLYTVDETLAPNGDAEIVSSAPGSDMTYIRLRKFYDQVDPRHHSAIATPAEYKYLRLKLTDAITRQTGNDHSFEAWIDCDAGDYGDITLDGTIDWRGRAIQYYWSLQSDYPNGNVTPTDALTRAWSSSANGQVMVGRDYASNYTIVGDPTNAGMVCLYISGTTGYLMFRLNNPGRPNREQYFFQAKAGVQWAAPSIKYLP